MGTWCSTEDETKGELKSSNVKRKIDNSRGRINVGSAPNDFDDNINDNILSSWNHEVSITYKKLGRFELPNKQSRKNLEWKRMTILEDGTRYEGEWDIDSKQRCGFGIYVWTDGSIYEGMIENGKAHGQGRLIHADGDVYEGEWDDDKACGKGLYTHKDGASYEGKWMDDKQHGDGIETWPDGAKYEGPYQHGMKHGEGVFYWSDKSIYRGNFNRNNIEVKYIDK